MRSKINKLKKKSGEKMNKGARLATFRENIHREVQREIFYYIRKGNHLGTTNLWVPISIAFQHANL